MEPLHQGDILKIEKIKHPVLVASQDFFDPISEIMNISDAIQGIFEYL